MTDPLNRLCEECGEPMWKHMVGGAAKYHPAPVKKSEWEAALRLRLATLCMAATGGRAGDMATATDDIISFIKTRVLA